MDPRFEARREAVERDGRRRRRNQFFVAIGAISVVAGSFWLTRSSVLDVDRLAVVGADRTGADRVVAASGLEVGDRMVGLDIDSARLRIEALPWVRVARLARSWPGTVRITVVERAPVATVMAAEGGWFALDADGRILEEVEDRPGGLILIDGVARGGTVGGHVDDRSRSALGVVSRFPTDVAARAERVRFVSDGQLELVLQASPGESIVDGGEGPTAGSAVPVPDAPGDGVDSSLPVVLFGGLEFVEEKLLALEAVLAQVDDTCLGTIDVRATRDVVVTRREDCR